ncbi:MAG TPA: hypothetical protein VK668_21715 [Mucilaginibacter sp.]|nr:hypothetical protein [Mucilaginibacter sp.]
MKTLNCKIMAVLIMVITTLTFPSCSSDTRVSQAREKLEEQVQKESKGLIKLKNLVKVNGKESSLLGAKIYEMDFKVTVEYQDDCYKNTDSWGGLWNNYFTVVKDPQQERSFYNAYSPANYKQYKKGTKEEITGIAFYEMKEKGWFLSDLNLKSSKEAE